MNPARILTVCMAAMLVAGGAAFAAEPTPDPRTTVLPIYVLSDRAAADGNLAEWAGVPPVPAGRFNIGPQDGAAGIAGAARSFVGPWERAQVQG